MTREERIRAYFKKDAFVQGMGAEIMSVDETCAVVRACVSEKHRNAHGCAQGGMLYTLADFAFAVHANYLHPVTVTQTGNISYLKAVLTDEVTATAREKARVGRNTVSEVVLRDGKGEIVCVASFNGFVKETELSALL